MLHSRVDTMANTISTESEGNWCIKIPMSSEPMAEAEKSVALCRAAATPETSRNAEIELFMPSGAIMPNRAAKMPDMIRKDHKPEMMPKDIRENRMTTKIDKKPPYL